VAQLRNLKHAQVALPELRRLAKGEPVESIRIDAIHVLGLVASKAKVDTRREIEKMLDDMYLKAPKAFRGAIKEALAQIRTPL
jgi:hypothetical protein